MKICFLSLIVLISVQLVGCATSKPARPSVAELSSDQAPVEVKVVSEQNSGQVLTLQTIVHAKTSWPAGDIALELTALAEGQEIGRNREQLPSGTMLAAGQDFPLTISVRLPPDAANAHISDYRLDCVWGAQANERNSVEPSPDHVLRSLNISVQERICDQPPCEAAYVVAGELFNPFDHELNKVTLSVEYQRREEIKTIGKNAEKAPPPSDLELTKLHLPPGASQKIRVVFDPLPANQLALVRPVLTVKSAE